MRLFNCIAVVLKDIYIHLDQKTTKHCNEYLKTIMHCNTLFSQTFNKNRISLRLKNPPQTFWNDEVNRNKNVTLHHNSLTSVMCIDA